VFMGGEKETMSEERGIEFEKRFMMFVLYYI
jgi:hypothetical protein